MLFKKKKKNTQACLVGKKALQIIRPPLSRKMNQALAEPRIRHAAVAILTVLVGDDIFRHHDVIVGRTFISDLGQLGELLGTLRGGVPGVVGAGAELVLAVGVAAGGAVAAGPGLPPEEGAEARLPQRVRRTVLVLALLRLLLLLPFALLPLGGIGRLAIGVGRLRG